MLTSTNFSTMLTFFHNANLACWNRINWGKFCLNHKIVYFFQRYTLFSKKVLSTLFTSLNILLLNVGIMEQNL